MANFGPVLLSLRWGADPSTSFDLVPYRFQPPPSETHDLNVRSLKLEKQGGMIKSDLLFRTRNWANVLFNANGIERAFGCNWRQFEDFPSMYNNLLY